MWQIQVAKRPIGVAHADSSTGFIYAQNAIGVPQVDTPATSDEQKSFGGYCDGRSAIGVA